MPIFTKRISSHQANVGLQSREDKALLPAFWAMSVVLSLAGCAMMGSSEPHADGPGATTPTSGPTLCHDGTAPPCNDRG